MRLVTSSEIQEMDRIAIGEFGIPGGVLMENAARGASRPNCSQPAELSRPTATVRKKLLPARIRAVRTNR